VSSHEKTPGADIPAPGGCRHCGADRQDHCQRYAPDVGRHGFVEPTDEQRLARLKARRNAKEARRG
jgi:hypothetical protein